MKKIFLILLFFTIPCYAQKNFISKYSNPIDVLVADPFVFHENDTYYLYGTSASEGFKVYISKDIVNWRYKGFAFKTSKATWPDSAFWAPEVYKKDSDYFMFYCARGLNKEASGYTMRLCVAKSSSPLGPFKDIKSPAFCVTNAVIDPHVFVDDNGEAYLFYTLDCSENTKSEIWVGKLKSNWIEFEGKPVKCFGPSQIWEGDTWNEAPFVMKKGKYYYAMYSANYFASPDYSVGYAIATNIFGPWKKYEENPILKLTNKVWGPGHHCVTKSPDGKELFIVYHSQQRPGSGARQVAIDRLVFEENKNDEADILKILGPTVASQKFPSGAKPFPRGKSDEFNNSKLDCSHWLIFGEDSRTHKIKNGKLIITTLDGDVYRERSDIKNLFFQYAPVGNFEIETKVFFKPEQNYEQVSLFVWQDHNNYLRLSYVFDKEPKIEAACEINGEFKSKSVQLKNPTFSKGEKRDLIPLKKVESPFPKGGKGDFVFLKIKKIKNHYNFYFSPDNKKWRKIGKGFETEFKNLKVGINATAPVSERNIPAEFDYFSIKSGQ